MKVVAVVPIKLNNERLPNKNITPLTNGKALVSYVLETLLSIERIDDVYVYCSDDEILKYISSKVKYIKRDRRLDSSETKMNEILYEFSKEVDADIYILSHATSPFIGKKSIEEGLINVLNSKNDSALSVQKLQEFLWKDNKPLNYELFNIPRTQDLEHMYMETSGFYIFKKDLIVNENRRVGHNPYLVEVSKIEGVDIDEFEDFEIANAIYNFILKNEGRDHG